MDRPNSSPLATLGCLACASLIAVWLQGSGTRSAAAQGEPQRYVDLVFDEIERTNDVTYGRAIDIPSGREVELKLDIYEPAGDTETERPVFIFFFGGGFVGGTKDFEPRFYCELMARRGYVAVAPSYRINQGNIVTQGIPAAVSDARQSVNWLIEHADEHRLDTGRIVIGGSSAGAITALFSTYTDYELAGPADRSQEVALVLDLWGGLYNEVGQMEAGEPPLAIIHGTRDTVVPFSEAENLRDRAEQVDIPYLFHPLQGEGHAPFMPDALMSVFAEYAYDRLWLQSPIPSPTAEPNPTATDEPEPTETSTATGEPTRFPEPSASPSPPATASPTIAPPEEVYLPLLQRG